VLLWSRDIGRFILGAEEHPTRHTVLPECHRLPKNIGIYSGMLQMGGRAQPVRACADDDNLFGEWSSFDGYTGVGQQGRYGQGSPRL